MKRSDQQPKHRVKLWLEQDGCPVTDTTAAIAARKRAKLLGKDQGRDKEHTVSGTLSGCLFTSLQETCDSKGRKIVGKQVSKSSTAADDHLWIFQPDSPAAIQGSSHLISLTDKRYEVVQTIHHTQQPAETSAQQQQQDATLGPSWAKLQDQLQDAGTAAVAELKNFGDLVGRKVSVWWPDDQQYYIGLITDYYCHNNSNSSSTFDSRRSSPDPPEAAPAAADQASAKDPCRRSKHACAATAANKGKDTVLPKKHRGPGRPPKSAKSVETVPTDAAAVVSGDKIHKRGPGRPAKKLAAAAGSLSAGVAGGVKMKKHGQGRQPKKATALLTAAASGSEITGGGGGEKKRRPGRPPKPAAAAAAKPAAGGADSASQKRGRPPKPRGEIVWGKHRIEYEDGEVELLDLSRETWHLSDDDLAAINTRTKQQQASRSNSKNVPLPAVGDNLNTFTVDRPAAVGTLMADKQNSSVAAAAKRSARGGRITKRKDIESASSSDSSSSEDDSSGAESASDESSSGDDSSTSELGRDDSHADSDAADADRLQEGDQQKNLFKRKREAVADPAGSGSKCSKAAAGTAAIAAAAAGMGGTPATSSKHIASLEAELAAAVPAADTGAAVAAEAHQASKDAAATVTTAAGTTRNTAKTLIPPTPTTSGTSQPATAAAARTAASGSSKPQQSTFLGVLSAGFQKFMVSGGNKAPAAAAAKNASSASLQAATAAAAAAAVSRAVAARAGAKPVTVFKPTGRATSISPHPSIKAADKNSEAVTGPAGTPTTTARDAVTAAGMPAASSEFKDVPAAAAATAATAANRVKTKPPSPSPPPHSAAVTSAAADKADPMSDMTSSPPAAAAAGLSTAVSMDLATSAAAAAAGGTIGGGAAAAVQLYSSSTAPCSKLPIEPPATDSDTARDSVAVVTDTAAAADARAAAAPLVPPEADNAQHDHQASRSMSAAAATQAVVMDYWQHVPVLKAEAAAAVRTPGAADAAAVAGIDGGGGCAWPAAGNFDGDAAAVAAVAADVAAVTPARELLDELTARLGQMDAAAAAGSSNGTSTTKAPVQMQMLVAKDNMQFSLLTEQLTAGDRGHISNAAAAAARHGSTYAAAEGNSCLAVLLVKLPAGFDRTSIAVQSSSRGLEVRYKAADRASSEVTGPAEGEAVQGRNMSNMTVHECTHVVHLPSDFAWVKGGIPADACDQGDGTSSGPAAVDKAAVAPVHTAAEVVGLLQYSDSGGKLMVLGKCCRA